MEKLQQVMHRLGTQELAKFLGEPSVALLEKLNYKNVTSSRLIKLIIDECGPELVLLDKDRRNHIFTALKPTEGEDLVRSLGLKSKGSYLVTLCRQKFSPSAQITNKLFEYFGCELVIPEQVRNKEPNLHVECEYPLFDHQRVALNKLFQVLSKDHGKVLLHMPTGSGKTRTAMNAVAAILRDSSEERSLIIWLAYSEELCDQAADEFLKSWKLLGNRKVDLHKFYTHYEVDLNTVKNGILIAGLGKLYSRSARTVASFIQMSQHACLVIMDEAHQATAPTYKHLLDLLARDRSTKVLGLSATPGRSFLDPGEDIKLARFFNHEKVTLEVEGHKSPLDYLYKEGYLAFPEFETIDYNSEIGFTQSDLDKIKVNIEIPPEILVKLASDDKRNLLILSHIMRESNAKKKIIVFACSVDHAKLLANVLDINGYKAAAITSETPSARRQKFIEDFRNSSNLYILTNYGVLTTGFDAPKANVAVIARPTKSVVLYSQMIGRVSRGSKVGGNKTCKIITINDKAIDIKDMSRAFRFWDDIW